MTVMAVSIKGFQWAVHECSTHEKEYNTLEDVKGHTLLGACKQCKPSEWLNQETIASVWKIVCKTNGAPDVGPYQSLVYKALKAKKGWEFMGELKGENGGKKMQTENALVNEAKEFEAIENGQLLGHIYFFSIPESAECPVDEFVGLLAQAGLDEKWAMKPPTPLKAFQRATNGLREEYPVVKDEETGESTKEYVLVRDAAGQKSFKHVVHEIIKGQEKPVHKVLGRMHLDSGGFAAECLTDDFEEQIRFEDMAGIAKQAFSEALKVHDARDLRGFMVKVRRNTITVPIRESGAFYFLPSSEVELINGLRVLLPNLGCEFHALPILSGGGQKELIAASFTKEYDAQVRAIYDDAYALATGGKKPTLKGYKGVKMRWERAEKMREAYSVFGEAFGGLPLGHMEGIKTLLVDIKHLLGA